MNTLQELNRAGQSVWIDFLSRGLIEDGSLERLIRDYGVGGVTSNPSIFHKAFKGSTHYDAELRSLAGREVNARDAFYELALGDARAAANLFCPVYNESRGRNGFVSFELEPALAHDTESTITMATELFAELDGPNVMIKVPGTSEGATAVEELTARGINVNITLLFSIEAYEAVADAYLKGLERRLEGGQPIDTISSVASFFVSRVDSAVATLVAPDSPIRGKVAIANARLAYERFGQLFSGRRWERLSRAGAKLQRPLWASTGTKDPMYSDVMYVEELVGRDTVITLPEQTLRAFLDHGRVRHDSVVKGINEAKAIIEQLPSEGVDLREIAAKLLEDGLAVFEVDLAETLSEIGARLHEASLRKAAVCG